MLGLTKGIICNVNCDVSGDEIHHNNNTRTKATCSMLNDQVLSWVFSYNAPRSMQHISIHISYIWLKYDERISIHIPTIFDILKEQSIMLPIITKVLKLVNKMFRPHSPKRWILKNQLIPNITNKVIHTFYFHQKNCQNVGLFIKMFSPNRSKLHLILHHKLLILI